MPRELRERRSSNEPRALERGGGVRDMIVSRGDLFRGKQCTDILLNRSRFVHMSAVDNGLVRRMKLWISYPRLICSGVYSPFASLDNAAPTSFRFITSVSAVEVVINTKKSASLAWNEFERHSQLRARAVRYTQSFTKAH